MKPTKKKLRSCKDQKIAIKKFTKELAKLERKHRVYIDGFCVTGRYRPVVDTKNTWDLDLDKQEYND